MVNKTAAFATLLTLGGAANGGMAQESMAQEGQIPASENNQILAETRTDTDSSPLREQTADSALEPQCYYNYIHFDRDGKCGAGSWECYRVAGASYSLFPLKERAVMDSFLDGGKGGVLSTNMSSLMKMHLRWQRATVIFNKLWLNFRQKQTG